VEDIGHRRLETHILDTSNDLSTLEVLVSGITAWGRSVSVRWARQESDEPRFRKLYTRYFVTSPSARPSFRKYTGEYHVFVISFYTRTVQLTNNANLATLGSPHTLLDGEDKVRLAGANIRSKDIATVALVVNAEGEFLGLVGQVCGRADYMLVSCRDIPT